MLKAVVAFFALAFAFLAGSVLTSGELDSHAVTVDCPSEDSCNAEYENGAYVVVPDSHSGTVECDTFEVSYRVDCVDGNSGRVIYSYVP